PRDVIGKRGLRKLRGGDLLPVGLQALDYIAPARAVCPGSVDKDDVRWRGHERLLSWGHQPYISEIGSLRQRTGPTTSSFRLEHRCPRSSARCWTSSLACSSQRLISVISAIRT